MNDILAALNAERYGRNHWWASPPSEHPETPGVRPNFDDSEVTCARRMNSLLMELKDDQIEEVA